MKKLSIEETSEKASCYAEAWKERKEERLTFDIDNLDEEANMRKNLYLRKHLFNDMFEWTPGNAQAVKNLNNDVKELYRHIYDKLLAMKKVFDAKIESGESEYKGYFIVAEVAFMPPTDVTEAESDRWFDLCNATEPKGNAIAFAWDRRVESFEEQMGLDEPSANENPFDVPELDDTCICPIIRDMFCRNETFSLMDALKMKKENFEYQVEVEFDWK